MFTCKFCLKDSSVLRNVLVPFGLVTKKYALKITILRHANNIGTKVQEIWPKNYASKVNKIRT